MDLSIVIPAYRSAAILPALVDRLLVVLNGLGVRYEIIFVEDDSPDEGATWMTLCNLQRANPESIIRIQLMRNFGQHNALMCGFRQARGRIIITMDDDLQHPPEEVPKLLDALQRAEFDLIYGVYDAKKHHAGRNLGSALTNLFYRVIFRSAARVTSFRAIRRELVLSILSYDLNFTYIDGLLAWNTRRVGQIAVEHQPRAVGRSGYSVGKLVLLAFNLFTNFSLLPLQIVSACGFFAAAGGLLVSFYYLVQYLLSNVVVPGYASTIIAILVLGGIQLMALGVLGEYLGRLHLNVNRKPQYTVRNVQDGHSPAKEDGNSESIVATPTDMN
jgi:polyisoprenyl-phosphate glycosyltransferase